jgi:hypothetical protein
MIVMFARLCPLESDEIFHRAAMVTVVRRTPSICPRNSCVSGIAPPYARRRGD